MWYLVVIVAIIWVGFFVWASGEYKKRRKKKAASHEGKPFFRSEEDLEEYAKPMKGEEHFPTVDMDDEE